MNAEPRLAAPPGTLRERIVKLVERAASPFDPEDAAFFAPSDTDDGKDEQRLQAWRSAVAGDDDERFASYLRRSGLTEDELRSRLQRRVLRDPASLPQWGEALLALLDGEAPSRPFTVENDPAIGLFLATASRWLNSEIERLALEVAPSARDGMLAVFAAHLRSAASPVLLYERRLVAMLPTSLGLGASNDRSATGIEAWLSRLEAFPALAYLVGILYRNWQRSIGALCERLAADRDRLQRELFGGEEPGPLIGFHGDLGDLHGHGQSVAILDFAGGHRAVYKPKDSQLAVAFLSFVAFLNQNGLEPKLHERTVLLGDGYAWEEFIPHKACGDEAAVGRFYTRMGMTIRLLQFLEGRDFWLDNLIACGEQPVFVDLEMLLQPRVKPTGTPPAENKVQDLIAESAIETSAITMHTPIEIGIPSEELGALAAPRPYLAPFRRDLTSGDTSKRPSRVEDFVTWNHDEHAPLLDGRHVGADAFLSEILKGYRAMQDVLAANADALLTEAGPLSAFRDAPVRFIYRDTWTCQKLIQRSVRPTVLADPLAREMALHQILQGAATQEDAEDAGKHHRIVASEILALRELDVPLFGCRTDGDAVLTLESAAVEGYFDGRAWDRLSKRTRELARIPIDEHVDIVRSCFATGHRHTTATTSSPDVGHRGKPDFTQEAVAIGEAILKDAAVGEDGSLAWLGFVYRPHIDQLSLETLQPDLLTGTCGIAMFFADLFRATGESRWRDAALGALASVRREASDAETNWPSYQRSESRRATPPYCGALCGVGAQIYALSYCARVLRVPDLLTEVSDCVAALPLGMLAERATDDVVTGSAGLLLALVAAAEAGVEGAVNSARELAALLRPQARSSEASLVPGYPAGAAYVDDVPNAALARRAAIARLIALGERDREMAAIEEPTSAPVANNIGDLVMAFALGEETVGTDTSLPSLVRDAERLLGTPVDTMTTGDMLQRADLAITASTASGRTDYRTRAIELATQLCRRRDASGSWFPHAFAADRHNLSIIDGLPAIGRLFLRVDGTLSAPSVLTFAFDAATLPERPIVLLPESPTTRLRGRHHLGSSR